LTVPPPPVSGSVQQAAGLPVRERPDPAAVLRGEVRTFLQTQQRSGLFEPWVDTWLAGFDPAFSAALGRQGWLGMTFPPEYGGHGRSAVERFVVIEELIAAGAPVAAHWFADRQVGPSLMRFGTDSQRRRFLPSIAAGECFFAIGLSEPDTGSDLAAVRTTARLTEDGWVVSGRKIWTSGAHRCHFMLTLVRTAPGRHDGLSQLVIDLSAPGITISPIPMLTGEHHFCEVVLDEVLVPEDSLIGQVGNGWEQVNAELAYERSGPERFLSAVQLIAEMSEYAQTAEGAQAGAALATLGDLYAQLWSVRQLSLEVAAALDAGDVPETAAAIVKDLGTIFEQQCVEAVRATVPDIEHHPRLDALLWYATLHSPGFTLRGGTNEMLRILVARGLKS
jgi:acyl-CoA dehydrogenase